MFEIGIRNGSGGKFQTGKDCSDALEIGNGTNVVSVNVVSELADGVVKLFGNGVPFRFGLRKIFEFEEVRRAAVPCLK